jgi:putative ABC transport system permease protein
VYLFSGIAVLILLVAGVNFVNLATARSTERAREVGVRKTLGAGRAGLVGQFLAEAVVLALLAATVALGIAQAVLPAFEQLAQADLTTSLLAEPVAVAALFVGALMTGLLAGAYPSLVLSEFDPAKVVKGSFDARPEGQWLRHGLVVTQFAASIALIAATFVVYNQLDYVQSKNLGFDREHVVTLPLLEPIKDRLGTLQREVQSVAGVRHAAAISSLPGEQHGGYSFDKVGREGDDHSFSGLVTGMIAQPGIVDALGLRLLAGERFPDAPTYSIEEQGTPFIINETIARGAGWTPREAIGQPLSLNGREGTVRGVVADFHVQSLRSAMDPVALFMEADGAYALDHAVVRLDGSQVSESLAGIESAWSQMAGGVPFSYTFLDDQYDALYRAEQRTGSVLGIISILAVFVACLGLVGLAAYTTQRRMKEISVRKVLGATVPQILALLSRNVLLLVSAAFVVAVPIAYIAAKQWLGQFAYATSVGVSPFLIAGIATAALATGATLLQTVRAAQSNPADVLQRE